MTKRSQIELSLAQSVQFRVNGTSWTTVTGNRSIALLAMLGLSADYSVQRRWVQQKLWSKRSSTQAQSSLRQVLFQIREALGQDRDILHSNRAQVWLRSADVDVFYDTCCPPDDFLSAIHIADPAFAAWLDNTRYKLIPQLLASANSLGASGAHTLTTSADTPCPTSETATAIRLQPSSENPHLPVTPDAQRIAELEKRVTELAALLKETGEAASDT